MVLLLPSLALVRLKWWNVGSVRNVVIRSQGLDISKINGITVTMNKRHYMVTLDFFCVEDGDADAKSGIQDVLSEVDFTGLCNDGKVDIQEVTLNEIKLTDAR